MPRWNPNRPARPELAGFSRRVKVCDACGRAWGLQGTIVLRDRESGDIAHLGSDCAARALGWRDAGDLVRRALRKQAEVERGRIAEGQIFVENGVDPDLVRAVEHFKQRDPSGRLKYLDWEIAVYLSGQARAEEIADVVDLFHRYGQQLPKKDLGQWGYDEFAELRDQLYAIRDRALGREKKVEGRFRVEEKPEYDAIYESDQVRACLIKNKAASIVLGAGTRWCVTQKSEFHYEDYDSANVVLVFLLSKVLPATNPMYKVAISFQRGWHNEILETIYWDAIDRQIDESKVRDLYSDDWSHLREVVFGAVVRRDRSPLAKVESGEAADADYDRVYEMAMRQDQKVREKLVLKLLNDSRIPKRILDQISTTLTNFQGNLKISKNVVLPVLVSASDVEIEDGASLVAPALAKVDNLSVQKRANLNLAALTDVGETLSAHSDATFALPALTNVGESVVVYGGADLSTPALASVGGDVSALWGSRFVAPALTSVGRSIDVFDRVSFQSPSLSRVDGDVIVREDASLDLPALESVGGDVTVTWNGSLFAPALKNVGGNVNAQGNAVLEAPLLKR